MSRRPILSAPEALDMLAAGKKQKEIARECHIDPNSVASVLMFERRRCNARTNMQLLAIHLTRRLKGTP